MKLLINPKFAATACLFGMLAAPAAVFADHPGYGGGDDGNYGKKKKYTVPEPSTLVMTLAGMGLAIGLAVMGLRRNRSRNVTT
jgi:hypothetical protein